MSAGRCRACAETTCTLLQGDHDFIKPLLEEIGDVKFGRVALKPGKPATFATVKVAQSGGGGGGGGAGAGAGAVASSSAGGEKVKLVFGLPGNPVSALVTFRLFVGLVSWSEREWERQGICVLMYQL